MTYANFIEELQEQLAQKSLWGLDAEAVRYYSAGFVSDSEEELAFIRDTNLRYHKTEADVLLGDYLVIRLSYGRDIENISRFDTKYLFQTYERRGWEEVFAIVKENMGVVRRVKETGIISQIEDYEAVRQKLIIRPVHFPAHRHELKRCVYERIGDIALVLYLVLYDMKEFGLGTTKVHEHLIEKWKVDRESIWQEAFLNTCVTAPPRLYRTARECCSDSYTTGAFMSVGRSKEKIGFFEIPTITTVKKVNGAIAMFYPGVKEKLAQMIGGSYYVAFTSIHEARIHREGSISARSVLQNLKHVNSSFDQAEILTRKVFYYNADEKTFSTIDY